MPNSTFNVCLDPLQDVINVGVDSRFLPYSATRSPTDYPGQMPSSIGCEAL